MHLFQLLVTSLMPLCLSFLIYKIGILITLSSIYCLIKWTQSCETLMALNSISHKEAHFLSLNQGGQGVCVCVRVGWRRITLQQLLFAHSIVKRPELEASDLRSLDVCSCNRSVSSSQI